MATTGSVADGGPRRRRRELGPAAPRRRCSSSGASRRRRPRCTPSARSAASSTSTSGRRRWRSAPPRPSAPTTTRSSSYREHGHCLAKGSDPRRIMAELFGRRDGLSKGKGGSMHLFDKSVNFLGGHGDRRRAPAARRRRRLRDQVPGRRPGGAVLLRRRRGARGRVPRVDEPGRALEAARHLHLREQPLRHGHRHPPGARADRDLELRRDLRHARRAGGRHGRAGRARVRGARGRAGAARQGARADRGPHLPVPRPLHARSRRARCTGPRRRSSARSCATRSSLFSERCAAGRRRSTEADLRHDREGGERPGRRGGGVRRGLAGAAARSGCFTDVYKD